MPEKLLESHKIRGSKILIDNFNNNYSIIFELQKLKGNENKKSQPKKWKVTNHIKHDGNSLSTYSKRGKGMMIAVQVIYDVISVSYQLSRIISINHISTWNILTYFTQGSQIQGHIFYIIYFILYSILYVHNLHLGKWNWSTDALWCKIGTESNMERWQSLGI